MPRATIGSTSRRARAIGARRLTASARSISSCVNVVRRPLAGRAAFATKSVDRRGLVGQPVDRRRIAEVALQRPRAELRGERLEHVRAPAGQQRA